MDLLLGERGVALRGSDFARASSYAISPEVEA
jgi:hypothetical protein